MHLSAIGKFAQDQIHHTAAIRDGDVSIPQYTVMPNHIHMMVVIHRRRDALNASLEPNAERTNNGRTNNGRAWNGRTNNERTQNGRTRCVPTTISPQWRRFGPQTGNLPSKKMGVPDGAPPKRSIFLFPTLISLYKHAFAINVIFNWISDRIDVNHLFFK